MLSNLSINPTTKYFQLRYYHLWMVVVDKPEKAQFYRSAAHWEHWPTFCTKYTSAINGIKVDSHIRAKIVKALHSTTGLNVNCIQSGACATHAEQYRVLLQQDIDDVPQFSELLVA